MKQSTSVYIDRRLWKWLRRECIDRDTNASAFFQRFLKYISENHDYRDDLYLRLRR